MLPSRTVTRTKGPTARARAAKKRQRDRLLAKAYAEVDRRDGGICRHCQRVTGIPLHHHHIRKRSTDPALICDTANIVLLCIFHHDAVEAKRLVIDVIDLERGANVPLRFLPGPCA